MSSPALVGLHHVSTPVADETALRRWAEHLATGVITDTGEVLMTPGDTVVIRGWSDRSDEPCLPIGTMIDATPAATDA